MSTDLRRAPDETMLQWCRRAQHEAAEQSELNLEARQALRLVALIRAARTAAADAGEPLVFDEVIADARRTVERRGGGARTDPWIAHLARLLDEAQSVFPDLAVARSGSPK